MDWKNKFKKKVYGLPAFVKDLLIVGKDSPALIASMFHRRVSRTFESKIMLTVTAVNGCKYCAWFHGKAALQAGLGQDEVGRLLSLQLNTRIDDRELTALKFAVHYAETCQKPDKALLGELVEVYGKETANDILLRLRLIYFGNLCGNTFEAFLSRLKGEEAENSFWPAELIIFLVLAPVLGPMALLMKKERL